jgi:menaquinone-dependent protoporphyrinogen oxidase
MRPILVVYATRHGHTRHIAERVADRIRTLRHEAQLQDARTEALPPLDRYSAVVLAASVHLGHHERKMVKFVRDRRAELERVPTVLLSVSLSEAAATDIHRPDDERLEAQRATRQALEGFVLETGFRPGRSVPVAGAVSVSTAGVLSRFLVRRLVRCEGLPEGALNEVVFTDWAALNVAVDALVREAMERSGTGPAALPEGPSFRSAVQRAVFAP